MSTWFSYAELCEGCSVWVTVYAEQELSFGHKQHCEYFVDHPEHVRLAAGLMQAIEEGAVPGEPITWAEALTFTAKSLSRRRFRFLNIA